MSALTNYRLLSFDVYGTLIDWEAGIISSLQKTLHPISKLNSFTREAILSAYIRLESIQQAQTPDLAYSSLLSTIHPLLASELGLDPPSPDQSAEFGRSIGIWPAFPDTVEALKRLQRFYKLVVLSNVDRLSFAATNAGALEGFAFDDIITAQDIGSYKPARANFEFMIRKVGGDFGVQRDEILQTAQSQFHDHAPAKAIGLRSVWIVRSGAVMGSVSDRLEEVWDWKFETLGEMADAVEKEFEAK